MSNNYIKAPPSICKFIGEFIVNNKLVQVYRVEIDDAHHFFTLYRNKKEVVFFINNTGEKWYVSLDPTVNRYIDLPDGNNYTTKSKLLQMGIEIVMIYDDVPNSDPDLTEARQLLAQFSTGRITFEIGVLHRDTWQARQFALYDSANQILLTKPVILCLTIGEFCVSSIEMEPDNDFASGNFIEIRSKTDAHHQNKHYNTMLRALALMVAPLIWTNAVNVVSYATNPLSVHTMVNRFGAKTDNRLFDNNPLRKIKKQMSNLEKGEAIPIIIPLSSETLERAKNIFIKYNIDA